MAVVCFREVDMEVKEDVDKAFEYVARKTNHILDVNRVPKNSGNYLDYEFGKMLLESYGLFSYQAIRILAAWVGV